MAVFVGQCSAGSESYQLQIALMQLPVVSVQVGGLTWSISCVAFVLIALLTLHIW